MNNLKYAPNLQIGDLVLITDQNWLGSVIISSFTKTNNPRYVILSEYWANNFDKFKYAESICIKKWMVKIDKSILTIDEQNWYDVLKEKVLAKYNKTIKTKKTTVI